MWYNSIMVWLIRSPLHFFVSKSMLAITYTGRKSGKTLTTPVNYLRMNDARSAYLLTTSLRSRTWWRNLRGGAPVTLRLEGKDVNAQAEAIEDPAQVNALLAAFFKQSPQMARYFNIRLDANQRPNADDLAAAVQERVVIQSRLAA